jgi:hypothetical protein
MQPGSSDGLGSEEPRRHRLIRPPTNRTLRPVLLVEMRFTYMCFYSLINWWTHCGVSATGLKKLNYTRQTE